MKPIEILKQIDSLISETESELIKDIDSKTELFYFFTKVQEVMLNYNQILEQEHFKQNDL